MCSFPFGNCTSFMYRVTKLPINILYVLLHKQSKLTTF